VGACPASGAGLTPNRSRDRKRLFGNNLFNSITDKRSLTVAAPMRYQSRDRKGAFVLHAFTRSAALR
jgi:hypothetical protein